MKTSLIGKALNFGFNEYRFDSYVFNIISSSMLLNQINLNITNKHFYLIINRSWRGSSNLLKLFKGIGLIKNYFYTNTNGIVILFNFIFNSIFFYKIILLSKNSNKIFISYKALKIVLKKTFSTNIFILTSKGLFTIDIAVQKKIGGILMFLVI